MTETTKAFLSVNDTWEKVLKIKSLSLDFDVLGFKGPDGWKLCWGDRLYCYFGEDVPSL